MGFLANRSIKLKLGLVLFALLSVSVLLGVSGTVGNVITQLELRHLSRDALVRVATATKIERMASALRLDALVYGGAGQGPAGTDKGGFADLEAELAALRGLIGEIDVPDLATAVAEFAARVSALARKPRDGDGITRAAGDMLVAGDSLRRAIEDVQPRATQDAFASVAHAHRTG